MRIAVAFSAALLLIGAALACAQTPRGELEPGRAAKMDPALRRLAASGADTVVGIFLRAAHPVTTADRRRLERAGVRIGTVAGALLSGRVSARRLSDVAALGFVTYMELAVPLRPLGVPRPRRSSPRFHGTE